MKIGFNIFSQFSLKIQDNKAFIIRIIVVFLFSLALLLRLIKWSHFDAVAGDEGVQLLTAEHLLTYGEIPLGGEISALDKDEKFIIHNSPIGLFFLTLTYFLGLRTPEGYVLVFVLLNIIQAYLLFKTSAVLFSHKAAFVTLLFALFSPTMLFTSTWPSQPTNAVFFETVALYLYAKFIRDRKTVFFVGSSLISLLATQMYPPMYLLLLPKVLIFVHSFQKLKQRSRVFLIVLMGAILIYAPLLWMEISSRWINTRSISSFLRVPSNLFVIDVSFISRLINNFRQLFLYLTPRLGFSELYFVIALLGSVGSLIYVLVVKKLRGGSLLALLLLLFIPPLLLAIVIREDYGLLDRTYLYATLPYLYLAAGGLIALVTSRLFVLTSSTLVLVLIPQALSQQIPRATPHLEDTRRAIEAVGVDATSRAPFTKISLYAMSEPNPYGWETSLYWYLLERETKLRLVKVDFVSNLAERINSDTPRVVYLICHHLTHSFTLEKCAHKFESDVRPNVYPNEYLSVKQVLFPKIAVVVYELKA